MEEEREDRQMTCPYLKEVTMVFCRAYPVKKLVPLDRVTTECTCEGNAFRECPLFREAHERAEKSAEGDVHLHAGPRGANAMMFAFVLAVIGVAVVGTMNLLAARAA
jgi:hypothetical protein